jgi:hypothetical protein
MIPSAPLPGYIIVPGILVLGRLELVANYGSRVINASRPANE